MQAQISDNRHPRAHRVRQPHGFDDEGGVGAFQAQRNKQDLILLLIHFGRERGFELGEAHSVERTLEDRVLQPGAEAFENLGDPPQPFRLADVVTDQISDATAHRVVNP